MPTEWSTDADDTPDPGVGTPPGTLHDWSPVVDRGPEAASEARSPDSPEHDQSRSDIVVGADGEDEMHRSAVDAVDGLLDEVELALSRLDDGTYGRCEECGEAIDDGRLAELPIVRICGRCDPDEPHLGANAGRPTDAHVAEPATAGPAGPGGV
jgi:RNA polymerase-binding transcription factor DksA